MNPGNGHSGTIDAFWQMKRTGRLPIKTAYEAIEMPHNSPVGFVTAFFATVRRFSLIWHIWWLANLGFIGDGNMMPMPAQL